MKLFTLQRIEDASGVSGTGDVAQGVEFDDGTCALRWLTEHRSTALYESIDTLNRIHGHNGKTRVCWTGATDSVSETPDMKIPGVSTSPMAPSEPSESGKTASDRRDGQVKCSSRASKALVKPRYRRVKTAREET